MGRRYTQLTIDERREIACLRAAGRSIRQIAATLDRQPSTIARELTRNRSRGAMASGSILVGLE